MLSYQKYYPKYKFLIYKLIRQYASVYNFDDMSQAAHLGYAKALSTFKKTKACLGTWIFINVRKCCQDQKNQEFQTKAHSETRKKLPKEQLYRIFDDTLFTYNTPYDNLLEKSKESEIAVIVALMSRRLTKLERCIFMDYYLKNKSLSYLRNKYKIQDFDNIFQKFKIHLKDISRQLV